jgi:hypothetical protein
VGSSSSKPRKGHEKPKHLPKVGSPANEQWEHETHKQVEFGSTAKMMVILAVGILAVAGLLILTL